MKPAATDLPEATGLAEVDIVSPHPEAARQVAEAIRHHFACNEQRSYPVEPEGTGTRLHLTVDAMAEGAYEVDAAGEVREPGDRPLRPWLTNSRPRTGHPYPEEHV